MDAEELKTYLQKHLSAFRYAHSLMVAEEAQYLAELYHEDPEKAYLVGLAHDIAKELSEEENLSYLEAHQLPQSYLSVVHSDIGATIARDLLSFDDDMCQAIKYHTIGNAKMTVFDKIIFITDKIARQNLSAPLENVKKLAHAGHLDQALLAYLQILESELSAKNLPMHPDSLELIQSLAS